MVIEKRLFYASMNPCPCGYLGDRSGRCHCTIDQVQRYRSRISGPLLDRIDMHIEVPSVAREVLLDQNRSRSDTSRAVQARVQSAYQRQLDRAGKSNGQLNNREVERFCRLSESDLNLLESAIERLGLSARAMHRILKVARTVADLSGNDTIETPHLSEAISYRRLERLELQTA